MHHRLSKMWCTIRNFMPQIVLGIGKANYCIENHNESNKVILSNYVHSWRVPLWEERQTRATTDWFPSPKSHSKSTTSETLHSNLHIWKHACGTPCKQPLVWDCMLQSAQQGMMKMSKAQIGLSHEQWAVVKGHGADWSLEIQILKIYHRSVVLWGVGMLVGSCWLCLHSAHDTVSNGQWLQCKHGK